MLAVPFLLFFGVTVCNSLKSCWLNRNRVEDRQDDFAMPELPPYDPARARAHLMELERRRRREENKIRAELRRLRADIRNPFAQAENLQ